MRTKSLLIKLIVFGSVVSIFPVLFVGIFSTAHSSREIQEQNNDAEMQLIQQVKANVEQIFMMADHALTNLLESAVMDEALYSPLQAKHFQLFTQLRKEITRLQTYDTKVDEVILLNNRQNWLVRNDGIQPLEANPDSDTLMGFFDLPDVSSWQLLRHRDFKELFQSSSCSYTISAIRKLPHYRTDKYALAFLNIPACTIAERLHTGSGENESMILDEQQQIIVHGNQDLIGTRLSEHPLFPTKAGFLEPSGQFQFSADDRTFTATYIKSSLNKWTYLSVVPVDQLTKKSRQIQWFALLVVAATIAVSMIFVWFISRSLYFPVNKLVQSIAERKSASLAPPKNEIQLIESYIEQLFSSHSELEMQTREHRQHMQILFLSRLYSGALKPSEIEERLLQFDWDVQMQGWRSMTVLTLQVDTLDNTRYESKDLDLLLFAISNIVEELISSKERLPSVWFDRTLVVVRGHAQNDAEEVKEADYKLTESLKKVIETLLHLPVSIGISSKFHHISQASRAYEEGLAALSHRLILGKSVIVPYSSLSEKPTVIHEYPLRIENELIDSIKLADSEEANLLLAVWMREVVNGVISPADYHIFIMRLLNRILLLKQEAGISLEQLGFHKGSLYLELLSLQMSGEIESWFREKAILPLIAVFHERRKCQYHSLSEQMIDFIHQHVEEDLTLERCAESMNYNASYLSSVFKNETGQLFSAYLAAYRLQVAKQWLTGTSMTVKEIAEKLRYSNSHNFIRSFRKIEGMTPGQYRAEHALS